MLVIGFALLGFLFYSFKVQLDEARTAECDMGFECPMHEPMDLQTVAAFALVFSGLALGVYLLFFEKSQRVLFERQEILKKELRKDRKAVEKEQRFKLVLSALDEYEQTVLKAVREQDGITQSTLRIRTGLSKSKLSTVLSELAKRGFVEKTSKGKTYAIHLKKNL